MFPHMRFLRNSEKTSRTVLPRRRCRHNNAREDDHKFNNLTSRWYVPRVIYFDLESLHLPVYGPQPDPQKSSTQTIEIHQPCGYALAVIEFGKKDLLKFELKRGPIVMEELISSLESLARQIYVEKGHITFPLV